MKSKRDGGEKMATATQISIEEMEIQAEEAATKWADTAHVVFTFGLRTNGVFDHILEVFAKPVPAGVTAEQLLEALAYDSEKVRSFLHFESWGREWLTEALECAIEAANPGKAYLLIEYDSETPGNKY